MTIGFVLVLCVRDGFDRAPDAQQSSRAESHVDDEDRQRRGEVGALADERPAASRQRWSAGRQAP
jgi:hypothetical protein